MVGLALMVTGIVTSSAPRRELRDFHRARPCTTAGGGHDCISRSAGTVIDRTSRVVGSEPEVDAYFVTIRSPEGYTNTFSVSVDLYFLAKKGRAVQMEIWRGHITHIAIGDQYADRPPTSNDFTAWLIGWAGTALAMACVVFRRQRFAFWFGFIAGVIVYAAVDRWSQAWYVVPLIVIAIMVSIRARIPAGRARTTRITPQL